MDRIVVNETLASLPVTDIGHVIKEINRWRLVLEMMEQAREYQRKYNIIHQERRKRNEYTTNNERQDGVNTIDT